MGLNLPSASRASTTAWPSCEVPPGTATIGRDMIGRLRGLDFDRVLSDIGEVIQKVCMRIWQSTVGSWLAMVIYSRGFRFALGNVSFSHRWRCYLVIRPQSVQTLMIGDARERPFLIGGLYEIEL